MYECILDLEAIIPDVEYVIKLMAEGKQDEAVAELKNLLPSLSYAYEDCKQWHSSETPGLFLY